MKKIVLMTNDHFNTILIPVTKEQCDSIETNLEIYKAKAKITAFTEKMDNSLMIDIGIKYSDILELGDTIVSGQYANSHIDKMYIKTEGRNVTNVYKCHCCYDWKDKAIHKAVYLHEDGLSSWKCAMDVLKHPTHAIVVREKIKEILTNS